MRNEISRDEALKEARAYLAEAETILKKVPIQNGRYQQDLPVRKAAEIAFLAPLTAIYGIIHKKDLRMKTL